MRFETTQGSAYLPFEATKYNLAVKGTNKDDFIKYVSNLAESKGLEMYFFNNEKVVCAYFNDRKVCYYLLLKEDEPPAPKESNHSSERKEIKVQNSSVFAKSFLIFILLLTSLFTPMNTQAYFSGDLEEDSVNYEGLTKAKFNTPSGSTVIPGHLSRVTTNFYSDLAFTFNNPRRMSEVLGASTSYTLPGGTNKSLVEGILAYRVKYTLDQIREESGLNLTQRQVDEATQLALWVHAASVQVDFQIDPNSISDAAVRTLATNITTWASKQVTNAGQASVPEYIFPTIEAKIDSTNAKMTREGDTVYYGPYNIQAQQKTKYSYNVLGGLIVDTSKKKVDSVITGQHFYIQFPVSYNGDKNITLSGSQTKYTLGLGSNRVWLHQEPIPSEIKFSVGGTTGTNGLLNVITKDSITGKPVPGVTVEISTTSPLDTVVTGETGNIEYPAPVGKYELKFNVPTGYLTPAPVEVSIDFAGDIKQVPINLEWSQAVMNFYGVDAKTLAPAGDSEAFIYDSSGKAVKRIALTKGSVKGITLPEGDYLLVQYKTSDNYALNPGVPFKALAGKSVDVTVPQDPNVMPTTIHINGAGLEDTWVYTISNHENILFRMNGTNKLTIPLPNGSYSVKATKSDGSSTAGPLAFSTSLNGETRVDLDTIRGEETITFNVVDTKVKQPIPNVILGLFDEEHNLIQYKTANGSGQVIFEGVVGHRIYYVNVLGAPSDVSGYSAVGNRFLGRTKTFELQLYSLKEIQEVTQVDTIYRVPNITYAGPSYTYPQ